MANEEQLAILKQGVEAWNRWRREHADVPDLSGIQLGRAELRRVAAQDEDGLHRALGPALDRVSAANARAYFRHCGYERPD